MSHRVRNDCRLCGAIPLETVLELAPTPPANEFLPADFTGEQEKFPLYLAQCKACGHVQLPVVVDPERLFRNYVYVSGTSPAFVAHFERYAQACIAEHGLSPGDLVVEVGSNDGTLLRFFQQAGMRVIGVDPAEAIAASLSDCGRFLRGDTVQRIEPPCVSTCSASTSDIAMASKNGISGARW